MASLIFKAEGQPQKQTGSGRKCFEGLRAGPVIPVGGYDLLLFFGCKLGVVCRIVVSCQCTPCRVKHSHLSCKAEEMLFGVWQSHSQKWQRAIKEREEWQAFRSPTAEVWLSTETSSPSLPHLETSHTDRSSDLALLLVRLVLLSRRFSLK